MPLNVSLNCSFIVLISGFGFFFLTALTSVICFWNSEAGEGLSYSLLMNSISDSAKEGNCSLLLEIREPEWSHLSRQPFIFVYSLYATLIRVEH